MKDASVIRPIVFGRFAMIRKDSPLRNPPASMAPEQRVAIDGIRYVAEMIGLNAERLYTDLLSVTWIPESGPLPPRFFAFCLADAWSIVDNLWRLNLLVRGMRGLKKTPELEVHLRALGKVEEFRHGFQHLNERVKVCASDRLPLWGTLGWLYCPNGPLKPSKIYLMVPGGLRSGEDPVINPAGKVVQGVIDLVTLAAFGKQLELSSLLRTVSSLIVGLERGLGIASSGQPGGGADMLISLEYVPQTENATHVSNPPGGISPDPQPAI